MTRAPRFAIIDVPSALGLRPSGVQDMPAALRRTGLAQELGAVDAGRIDPPSYSAERDPETLLLNGPALRDVSRALASLIQASVGRGEWPVVLAGDCSVVLGATLALRKLGAGQGGLDVQRFGLLFLDGHVDFYQPEASPTGEVADMDLALATGRGPSVLADIDSLRPYVADADVVAFGARDAEERTAAGSQDVRDTAITVLELNEVRALGIDRAADNAVSHLARRGMAGFWVHIDADVLDDAVMPAVDYRRADGLSPAELTTVLRRAMRSGLAVGASVAIYNASLDPGGIAGRALAGAVRSGLLQADHET
ncbi:MAG: arginase family protein [Gemmatimonadota bacterium]|nr:arginase family protein [Gemmatimonadota bacterium]